MSTQTDKLLDRFDPDRAFPAFVEQHVSPDGHISVALTNSGVVPLALNLAESFVRADLTPPLFVALNDAAHRSLADAGLPAFRIADQSVDHESADFGSASFNQITSLKFGPILRVLEMGRPVLLIDVDIALFSDPFPYFDEVSDIQIQYGQSSVHNPDYKSTGDEPRGPSGDAHSYMCTGFVYFRPTARATQLVSDTLMRLASPPRQRYNDQDAFNDAYHSSTAASAGVRVLDPALFPVGSIYSERTSFGNYVRRNSVILHANYWFGMPAKIAALRRAGLWSAIVPGNLRFQVTKARLQQGPVTGKVYSTIHSVRNKIAGRTS